MQEVNLFLKVLLANASNKKLTWKTSNLKVATVTQAGIVILKKHIGGKKVTITVTTTDRRGKKQSIKIKIKK